jgi:multidrug efflux pump subunit AcrB
MRLLTWSMRYRWWLAIAGVLVIASSIPLYGLVRQEFVPSKRRRRRVRRLCQRPGGRQLGSHERSG